MLIHPDFFHLQALLASPVRPRTPRARVLIPTVTQAGLLDSTTMPPENQAAYLDKNAKLLEVRRAPYTSPGSDELVVRNEAIAINPVDVGVQVAGTFMFPYLNYPSISGSDVSGVVVEVGSGGKAHKLFQAGDRVVGHAVGTDQRSNKPSEGAFQRYTVLRSQLTSKIPNDLPCEKACVLPLALSTAACGLFLENHLALRRPKLEPGTGEAATATAYATAQETTAAPAADVVIVWGASTTVGSNAVQLARAAGYEVLATASPKNFDYVKSLGASRVFDYKEPDTVQRMIDALQSRNCVGALAIGIGSLDACINVVAAVSGRKFVSQASIDVDVNDMSTGIFGVVRTILQILWANISMTFKARIKRVSTKFIWGSDVVANELGPLIYNDFLPGALTSGQFQAKPDPAIVGNGLERLQEGLEVCKKGQSATKAVITL